MGLRMPTGIYIRTKAHRAIMNRCLAIGRAQPARQKAAARMRELGKDQTWRDKVSQSTQKAMREPIIRARHLAGLARAMEKHGVNFRGGNGQEPVMAVQVVASALCKAGFVMEYPVLTKGHGTGLRCPHAYKVDFGNPITKEAIELDGPCHRIQSRRALDFKKDTVLKAVGWTVTRIKHD